MISRIAISVFILCLLPCCARAQVSLPAGSGPVPSLSQPGQRGAIVSAERVSLYKESLPAEVLALVNDRRLVLEVGKVEEDLFRAASYSSSSESLKFDPEKFGELSYFDGDYAPFPAPQVTDAQSNPQRTGLALLWNAASVLAQHGYFDASLKLSMYTQRGSAPREVSLAIQRWYPRSYGVSPGKIPPLFRELISFTQPDILKGLKALTLRFFGQQDEDAVWFSSPTTESVRRVTGSNRADDFFAHALTPDDLFGGSSKVEGQRVIAVQRNVTLVPILRTENGKGFSSPPTQDSDALQCVELFDRSAALKVQRDSRTDTERGTGSTPLFQDSPPWNPSNVIWTPRNVWRVESVSRDPFSRVVRTITHIDEGSMTPVLRSTWNEKGEGIRTTIQIFFGGAATLSGQILFDGKGEGASVLTTESFKSCRGGGSEKVKEFLKVFDPIALVSAKKQDKKVGGVKDVARETEQTRVAADASSEENPQD